MEAPFSMENEIWMTAVSATPGEIKNFILPEAVILVNGTRYTGTDFIAKFESFGCTANTIDDFEVVANEGDIYEVTYKASLIRDTNKMVTETYAITSTWKNYQDNYFMVFAMAFKCK